jgi:hypothetical protein
MTEKKDNCIWVGYKTLVNKLNVNEQKSIFFNRYQEKRYIDVIVKLGYLERCFSPNQYYLGNEYKILKNIPEELRWMDALKLSKSIISDKKGRKKYSFFNKVVEQINDMDINHIFNRSVFNKGSNYNSLLGYFSLLTRLEYIEKVPERGAYKFIKRIPDGLTTTLANKMLTDKFYKRARKLQKLREKLNGTD